MTSLQVPLLFAVERKLPWFVSSKLYHSPKLTYAVTKNNNGIVGGP